MKQHSEVIKDLIEKFLKDSKNNLLFCEGIGILYNTLPRIDEQNKSRYCKVTLL